MLTRDALKPLADVQGPCLTLFQPLRMDDAAFHSAIQEAERLLLGSGLDTDSCKEMLRPLRKLALNLPWKGRPGSLVIFRAPGVTVTEFRPDVLAPTVHVSKEFLVLPLLPGLLTQREFWLLALSIKHVRLFRGSVEGIVETPLPAGVATSLAEDEAFDQPDHSLRGRSVAGPSTGSMKGVQFGTSSERELQPDYLHDYFRAIDRGIQPLMARDRHPLILAAVTRELAIYRRVNTYIPTLAAAIHGSPDSLGTKALHAGALDLMAAESTAGFDETRRRIEDAAGHHLLATDLAEIEDAAAAGRIEELIVLATADSGLAAGEAVNRAALATLRNSGRIAVLDDPHVTGACAAILRYRNNEDAGEAASASAT
jgi:hypothetical protein